MIDFLFLGAPSGFGRLPDLLCKSFNGTSSVEAVNELRKQIIDLKEHQICFLSIENLPVEELEDAINFLTEKILFLAGTPEQFNNYQIFFEANQMKLAGFVDTTSNPALNLSLVNNAHRYLSLKLKSAELINLGKDLNALASTAIEETNKLKDIHQTLVPLRKVEAKGIDIYSKFAAGTSAGGEFFDYSVSDHNVNILLTSTSSYILTSYFLTYVSLLKEPTNGPDLQGFIQQVGSEIKNLGLNLNDSSLLFLSIDLKRMLVKGYSFGDCMIFSSKGFVKDQNSFPIDWNFEEKAFFEYQLGRGEKLYLCSKGLIQNAKIAGTQIEDLIMAKPATNMEEEFNEIFYQLKKNRAQKFLEHDATCVILEVSENAIFSV